MGGGKRQETRGKRQEASDKRQETPYLSLLHALAPDRDAAPTVILQSLHVHTTWAYQTGMGVRESEVVG
jgi:hypothetical protein